MNIFYLDTDPRIAAQCHCDKHVVKMILETAQLLCTAHRELDRSSELLNVQGKPVELYKSTHLNHPSARWVRQDGFNYAWAYSLMSALDNEYWFRYGRHHATTDKLGWALGREPKSIPWKQFTPPPLCMPDQYKQDDPVAAYRTYYLGEKSDIATWTRRDSPQWWQWKRRA